MTDDIKEDTPNEEKKESQATQTRKSFGGGGGSKSTDILGYKVNNNDLIGYAGITLGALALGISSYLGWNYYNQNKKQEEEQKRIQDQQLIEQYLYEQKLREQQQPPPGVTQPQSGGYVDMNSVDTRPEMFNPYQRPQPMPEPPVADEAVPSQDASIDMGRYSDFIQDSTPQPPPRKKPELEPQQYPSTADLLGSMSGSSY